ncbi:MAG: arginine--tRNA ligase [Candidatus Omnitrophota bacterium]|jgi:arginyl-tRNA synthetase
MEKNIQDSLIRIIKDALAELYHDTAALDEVPVELSLATGFGDLSNNLALRLGSLLKQSPLTIASRLVESIEKNLQKSSIHDCIKHIKVEGAGFINFYLSEDYFYRQLKRIIVESKDFGRQNIGAAQKVMIEFVSANPTGPLSVAHARQAVVGDALASILSFLGFSVHREYYLNDEGNQINILGKSVALRLQELKGEKIEFPENCYQGDYIYDIARKLATEDTVIEDPGEYAGQYILTIIKEELRDFGISFDCWYSQKELRKAGSIEKTFEYLREKGFLFEQDGAQWFKSTAFADDKDRVVVKSDGSYTYLAPDIAYHQNKYKRGFTWLINLWGPDHHGYISRLKAAVQALGQDPGSLSVIIVQLASIFKDGKPLEMSTRRGQYITLREVLDEVGRDASRFFFVMRRTSSLLNFDLETAKKQTSENPVYYVQYAYARIYNIIKNSPFEITVDSFDAGVLKEKEELQLIRKLWQFSFILNICYKTLDPYMMTVYLQEIAEDFHRFYDRCRVLGNDEAVTRARLSLVNATRIVLGIGLDLLGISKPEKM